MNLRSVTLSDHPLVRELLDHYYKECPGTLFPLLLLYLARTGNLDVGERARPISYTDDSFRFTGHTLLQFSREDAMQTGVDPAGRRLLERWDSNGQSQISVVMPETPEDENIRLARELIHRHDDPLIRTASQKKAAVMLAQGLLRLEESELELKYRYFFRSALQHIDRYGNILRTSNAMTIISSLFRQSGGRAFIPYARLPWFAMHLKSMEVTAEFSKPEERDLDIAISALLFGGLDGIDPELVKAEKSFGTLEEGVRYGFVFSDREDRWAMDPVLTHMRSRLTPDATLVFLLDEKEFFYVACRQTCFLKDFVKEGKLDRVILLPREYHRVLVVIRNGKDDGPITLTNLYETLVPTVSSCLTPFLRRADLNREITLAELAGVKYNLGDFFRCPVPEKPGFRAMPLRRLLSSIPLSPSSFGSFTDDYEGYRATGYPSFGHYRPSAAELEIQKAPTSFLTDPVYLLDSESLVVRKSGPLEPCVVNPFFGSPVLFDDGIAFHVNNNACANYIINELRRPYVLSQLRDWDHSRDGLHSTDEILNLVILVPVDRDGDPDLERQESIARKELDDAYLPKGEEIRSYETDATYRIVEPLGRGCFGLSYLADRLPGTHEDGPVRVVLKEFFINLDEDQDTERDEQTRSARHSIGDIESIVSARDESAERRRFIREAQFMKRFGRIPDSHIRPASAVFTCKVLNNVFYETVFYTGGDLDNLLSEHGEFEEKEAIERFIIPIAKALHVMHSNRYVHHDVKPENIFIDDDGLAVLGDFGVAKQYGDNGVQLSSGERATGSPFSAPEEFSEAHETFHPEMDVYSLGAVLYVLLTRFNPRAFDDEMAEHILSDPDQRVSEESMKAISKALKEDPSERFQTVMDFVHALPGHENDEFVIREPEEDADPEEETDDEAD